MRQFDTKVQDLKYSVLKQIARYAFEDRLLECYNELPKEIVPGPKATMRCCIYKERAIVQERMRIAAGGDKSNPNCIEVIEIACEECPVGGYEVTEACRGCIAHRCESVCKRNAISFEKNQKAHIDKDLCVECGKCATVCPYSAITNNKRPCEKACKVKAIHMSDSKAASIDRDKCIACGSCVYQCPFGAIMDKSFILDAVRLIRGSDENKNYRLYAIVAPSIASQFHGVETGKVIAGIKKLGFYNVVETALGADMAAFREAGELAEKGFLTSSCCPAFVKYVETQFPDMTKHISHNPSPMALIAEYIKKTDESAKIVFIGPCTAKKMEFQKEAVHKNVDCVLTFEELQALLDSRDVELSDLEPDVLDNASYYGRIFARTGGLAEAVGQALKERGLQDFPYNPISCDGIEACRTALLRASKNVLPNNFIEGMACTGGCIGGAGCLTHGEKDKNEVDRYGKEAMEKSISDAIKIMG